MASCAKTRPTSILARRADLQSLDRRRVGTVGRPEAGSTGEIEPSSAMENPRSSCSTASRNQSVKISVQTTRLCGPGFAVSPVFN